MNRAHHVEKLAWEALYIFSLAFIGAACAGYMLTERVTFTVGLSGGIFGIYALTLSIYQRARMLEIEDKHDA